jgi:hypothetical protein
MAFSLDRAFISSKPGCESDVWSVDKVICKGGTGPVARTDCRHQSAVISVNFSQWMPEQAK